MNQGRFPNFLCVGAPRSGTTWLYECLQAHPEAFVPALKEVSFFIRDEYRTTWHKGLDWYKSLFICPDRQVKAWGELSPRYYFLERTPALIREYIPTVKIIYLLRHPVEVIHSAAAYQLKMYARAIDPKKYGFYEYIDHHLAEPLGFYAKYYKRYAACFSPDQILVQFYEDLRQSPGQVFARICSFLGIDNKISPPVVTERINQAVIPRSFLISRLLNALAWRLGNAGRLLDRFDERYNRVLFKQSAAAKLSLVNEEIFNRLMSVYEDDIHELQSLTGRDLRHWFEYKNLEPAIRMPV